MTSTTVESSPPRTRRRVVGWTVGLVVVALLVGLVTLLFTGAAGRSRADDPESTVPAGNAALAQLLRDEGVRIHRTTDLDDAVARSTAGATVVVTDADRLNLAEAGRIARAPHARLILLRPSQTGLRVFGAAASASDAPGFDVLTARCPDPVAARADRVRMTDSRTLYRPSTSGSPQDSCYRDADGGSGYLRVPAVAGSVELVAGGTSNEVLAQEDNAAFAMITFGAQTDLVWLVARSSATTESSEPSILPPWWVVTVIQLVLAVAVAAVWRGRRLGPILVESLPIRVRASETVEGHGRLYHRIQARDRAAQALRDGARRRLGRAYGYRGDPAVDDPYALATAIATRTGRSDREVVDLLNGPPPGDDVALVNLARGLDALERQAQQL